jgi:murein L,D-transpeptidase YafK
MSRLNSRLPAARAIRAWLAALAAGTLVAACGSAPELAPADQPLTKETLMLLGRKGMEPTSPIFIRVFKEESELEVWKARDDGRYYHFKTYPICNWSGELGPKERQGDKQAPEGFYTVAAHQLNPNSQFHVSFNLGYPNAYDKAHGRTGDFLMIHGKCKSAGCYAMTDALMEEIYGLAREAIKSGQQSFEVHAFPFRMTAENMARHKRSRWHPFWTVLKNGYDHFEAHRLPPQVAVCERKYMVNVVLPTSARVDPEGYCPPFQRPAIEPFVPRPAEQQLAEERVTIPGPKTRTAANIAPTDQTGALPQSYGLGGSGAGTSGPVLGYNQ